MDPMDQWAPQRLAVSIGLGIMGVSLLAACIFTGHMTEAPLVNDLIQLILVISGSMSIILGVIVHFTKSSTDSWK